MSGKLLQFIEENQGFALNKPLRRVDARDIFDDIRRFVAVRGDHFVLWLLHEVDRDNARVVLRSKARMDSVLPTCRGPLTISGFLSGFAFHSDRKASILRFR